MVIETQIVKKRYTSNVPAPMPSYGDVTPSSTATETGDWETSIWEEQHTGWLRSNVSAHSLS